MQRLLTSITILLLIGLEPAWAVRVIEQLEGSYELRLADVTLPRSTAGSVTFKACDDCSIETVPVTASTSYFVGDREVTLAELTEQARAASQRSATNGNWTQLMVFYSATAKRATRLVLKVR
jgi:hypothetical protein